MSRALRILLTLACCVLVNGTASAGAAVPCQSCHDDYVLRVKFPGSVHGVNGCESCHGAIPNIAGHASGEKKQPPVACGNCHRDISRQFMQDFHYLRENLMCQDCHAPIHALQRAKARFKAAVIGQCTECHDKNMYVNLGHGKDVLAGNHDAAACSDCHGLHGVRDFSSAYGTLSPEARQYYTLRCEACHGDAGMMKRNNLSAAIVLRYEETYHGKVEKIGYPGRVAGCADCHAGHNILPPSDPRSSLSPANLVHACGKCHSGFNPRFVKFNAHPDYGDPKRYPALFWTKVFMIALIVSVFVFFWLHTALWWRKTYWEKCRREQAGIGKASACEEFMVRRFTPRDRIMHVLLILSFFTLVITGMPLKYFEMRWAKYVMDFLGGVNSAGILHRTAAVVLWALFLYTIYLTLRFLFPKGKGGRGWVGRLLGPDSLCPNMKDLRDIKGMFLWFFDRGEMPQFGRWTYWEKFDFFAVFWGMAAIGLSGLMLWAPEYFSWIVPGWMINIATLVHSEEALLAALFIFTVHFFNNHFLPTRFPMEPNIFTGCQGMEQFETERPLEYELALSEDRLEAMKCKPPGILIRFLSSALGLASLLLGLVLTLLIILTILFY